MDFSSIDTATRVYAYEIAKDSDGLLHVYSGNEYNIVEAGLNYIIVQDSVYGDEHTFEADRFTKLNEYLYGLGCSDQSLQGNLRVSVFKSSEYELKDFIKKVNSVKEAVSNLDFIDIDEELLNNLNRCLDYYQTRV